MAIYAIGDVQGCHVELQQLLDKLKFDATEDRLWFCGDLVNRGPASLESLRFIKSLGDAAISVLGNHDLHLLAVSTGAQSMKRKDTLQQVLDAPDAGELLNWLRMQPLIHYSKPLQTALLHAGLPPQWSVKKARKYAREVETVLRGPDHDAFFRQMYGNQPDLWDKSLSGIERLRFITNAFTRIRYVDTNGRLEFENKMKPNGGTASLRPWFRIPKRRSANKRIIFGHWSTLGFINENNVIGLDTGCVWGGQLTAYRLDTPVAHPISMVCAGALAPGEE